MASFNSDQLAIYIDFENLALWAQAENFSFQLGDLIKYFKNRGEIAIKRAYANWRYFDDYKFDMTMNAIDLAQVYSVGQGKNRADIRIALDAIEAAFIHDHIHTFVIVSGDSDFGPLANKLKTYGKRVVGVGPPGERSHKLFIRACDEFVDLGKILKRRNGREVKSSGSPDQRQAEPAADRPESGFEAAPSVVLDPEDLPLADDPALTLIWQDILAAQLPASLEPSQQSALKASEQGMTARKQRRFDQAVNQYLLACRLLWDGIADAPLPDEIAQLRWYMASYASVRAGEAIKHRQWRQARAYYLAFFWLIRDDDLRQRVDGLIKPMLTYYWGSAFREYGEQMPTGERKRMLMPAEMGKRAIASNNQQVRNRWQELTTQLAQINPALLETVVAQMKKS